MSGNWKRFALAVLILAALPVHAAIAADTQTYAALHDGEPALAAGASRFYFYREDGFAGAALQPTIMINGESTGGRAKPGDYFYLDVPPGSYAISTETEKKEAVTATIAAGQSMYIRFNVSMGFLVGHVSPSIIDPQQAVTEIKDCDYRLPKSTPSFAIPTATAPVADAVPAEAASVTPAALPADTAATPTAPVAAGPAPTPN